MEHVADTRTGFAGTSVRRVVGAGNCPWDVVPGSRCRGRPVPGSQGGGRRFSRYGQCRACCSFPQGKGGGQCFSQFRHVVVAGCRLGRACVDRRGPPCRVYQRRRRGWTYPLPAKHHGFVDIAMPRPSMGNSWMACRLRFPDSRGGASRRCFVHRCRCTGFQASG